MISLRRTALILLLLLVATAAGVGGYGFYLWNSSDELLRQMVLAKLAEIAPEWRVTISRARFDWQGRVHVYEFRLLEETGDAPLLDVPEAILTVDRDKLTEPDPPLRKVTLLRPQAHVTRRGDGTWNWQHLSPPNLPRDAVPEFRCERMDVIVKLPHRAGSGATELRFEEGDVQFIPSGKRQFLVKAAARFERADELSATGTWNVDGRTWTLAGSLRNLRVDGALLRLAQDYSAESGEMFERLQAKLASLPGHPAGQQADVIPVATDSLSAAIDLQFDIDQPEPDAIKTYKVAAEILRGEWRQPPVPYPLYDLRGRIELDNQQVELTDLGAVSGTTQLAISHGKILREPDGHPAELEVSLVDLPLDDRVHQLLPDALKRVYESIQPTGQIDAQLHLKYDGQGEWEEQGELTAKDVSAAHVKFPYRVGGIEGKVTRVGDLVNMQLTGRAGSRPIALKGTIKNPGNEARAVLRITTEGIPIDRKLYNACPPRFRKVIDELALQGELEGQVVLVREPGPDQPLNPYLKGKLQKGSVVCRAFPYPLTDVTADFIGGGERWTLTEAQGKHGAAEVYCSQAVWQPDENGVAGLEMAFEVRHAALERALFAALPPEWQDIWLEFNPQGNLAVAGSLNWVPGTAPQLHLDTQLQDARLSIRSFPLPFENVQAELHLEPGEVRIRSFSAQHDETDVRLVGWAKTLPDGEWQLHLKELKVDDLDPGRPLRRALPPNMRSILEACNPRGKISIRGEIEFRGHKEPGYPVTAAWDTTTYYTGNTITAGVDLKEMHGEVRFRGNWDGEVLGGDGNFELKSVKVFEYQFMNVRGPVRIRGNRLTVGDTDFADGVESSTVAQTKRLTARFIEGTVGLDAVVDLDDPMRYRALLTLRDGKLQEFARLYLPNSRNLAGVTNGWVEFSGVGTDRKRLVGTGRLLIGPAALYEQPVIVAVFKALTFSPGNNSAFDQADFLFDLKNAIVHFKRIDLVGNSIKLVGDGTVRFDGGVDLRFYSEMGRNRLPIPFVNEVIKEATKGWIGVDVTGTVKEPRTQTRPLPQLDNGLRRLLGDLDGRGPERR